MNSLERLDPSSRSRSDKHGINSPESLPPPCITLQSKVNYRSDKHEINSSVSPIPVVKKRHVNNISLASDRKRINSFLNPIPRTKIDISHKDCGSNYCEIHSYDDPIPPVNTTINETNFSNNTKLKISSSGIKKMTCAELTNALNNTLLDTDDFARQIKKLCGSTSVDSKPTPKLHVIKELLPGSMEETHKEM